MNEFFYGSGLFPFLQKCSVFSAVSVIGLAGQYCVPLDDWDVANKTLFCIKIERRYGKNTDRKL